MGGIDQTMRIRHILDTLWHWLGEDRRLWIILAVLLVAQLPALLLPQAPVSPAQRAVFTRWLAGQRPTLGQWADPLVRMGLLSFRSSLWMRAVVAAVALVTAARVSRLVEGWADLAVRRRWWHGLVCLGGALIVLGWGAQTLWGWSEPGIVAWPQQPLVLPERQEVLPVRQGIGRLVRGYGLYLIPRGHSVGLEVQATDAQGTPLLLQPSARGEARATLAVALTAREPEAFFALPAEELIVRISRHAAPEPADVVVEAYRSASGDLVIQQPLPEQDALPLNGARLHVTRHALPNVEAVYNPGAPFTAAGLILWGLGAGILESGNKQHEPQEEPQCTVSSSA